MNSAFAAFVMEPSRAIASASVICSVFMANTPLNLQLRLYYP
jgi:hypothetical protein